MRRAILAVLVGAVMTGVGGGAPAVAGPPGLYEVAGVEADDMLKMRAGPGVGYKVILGLPNGTLLRIYSCEPSGGTRWCKVALKQARGLVGYVSWAYLRQK